MISRLQRKTLFKTQLIGYILTLLVGLCIFLTSFQLYFDITSLFKDQYSDFFDDNVVIISKKISVFKNLDKEKKGVYFSEEEIKDIENQNFVKSVTNFENASYKIAAFTNGTTDLPPFYTDLFFESVPDKYIEVDVEDWGWNNKNDVVPIVIPQEYLALYNFGFAESQNLPVLSENTVSQIFFNIKISGKGKSETFKSRIVGFSSKINSILVPESFMIWANQNFGETDEKNNSRLLIEYENSMDEEILKFFNEKNYFVNEQNLKFSKLNFFFNIAVIFCVIISLIISILSIVFVMLSFNLMTYKNRAQILNLYYLGYDHKRIAKFYQIAISLATLIAVGLATLLSSVIRCNYLLKIKDFFYISKPTNYIYLMTVILIISLIVIFNFLIVQKMKEIVIPKRSK